MLSDFYETNYSYIDEKLRRPEFDVRFKNGIMEDDDNEEYFNHIKLFI